MKLFKWNWVSSVAAELNILTVQMNSNCILIFLASNPIYHQKSVENMCYSSFMLSLPKNANVLLDFL